LQITTRDSLYFKKILQTQHFDLFGQKQWSMDLKHVLSTEILLRIPHPRDSGVYLSPTYWVDLAVSLDLLADLTDIILKKIISSALQLDPLYAPYYINVPPPLVSPDFVDVFNNLLMHYSVSPQFVGIEFTERHPVVDRQAFCQGIDMLDKMNVPTALDDFGRGYATMQFLRDLRVNRVKIDQSLLQEAKTSPIERLTLLSLLDFSAEFDIEVIAEGVETQDDFAFAQHIGCHGVQGFFCDHPICLISY
jgi:EAL domain-containing protein (putative c-di-GMP-specific phosphodiesterase class I)